VEAAMLIRLFVVLLTATAVLAPAALTTLGSGF
jgi:hypothetical protein